MSKLTPWATDPDQATDFELKSRPSQGRTFDVETEISSLPFLAVKVLIGTIHNAKQSDGYSFSFSAALSPFFTPAPSPLLTVAGMLNWTYHHTVTRRSLNDVDGGLQPSFAM